MINNAQDPHVIVIGAGITGLLTCQALNNAGIRYSCFEKEKSLNYRSNEWTMAIHWALPLLKDILPPHLFHKMNIIACNPTVGIHSGLYPIINGDTGDLITGVPYENGLRVPRSKMRALAAEGINVQYGKTISDVAFNETGDGLVVFFDDGSIVRGTMVIGADGPRSKTREFAMGAGDPDKAAVTKFPIFHTNMTVCYNDAEKAELVRKKYPTSYLALSPKSFHAFQSISSMPDGPDHPESWVFHMAMAWLDDSPNNSQISYRERLALIKERAKSMGEPAHSAFMWVPDDTEVHKADISYWVTQPWDNRRGRITLVGDAAHPMPPYRGQGLNHCIKDVWHLSRGLAGVWSQATPTTLSEVISQYEEEMIPRGAQEVQCSVENGLMLHDWRKIQASPVFKRGFKPMDGHDASVQNGDQSESNGVVEPAVRGVSEHRIVQLERESLAVAVGEV